MPLLLFFNPVRWCLNIEPSRCLYSSFFGLFLNLSIKANYLIRNSNSSVSFFGIVMAAISIAAQAGPRVILPLLSALSVAAEMGFLWELLPLVEGLTPLWKGPLQMIRDKWTARVGVSAGTWLCVSVIESSGSDLLGMMVFFFYFIFR